MSQLTVRFRGEVLLGMAPAPIAVVSDKGPCFSRGRCSRRGSTDQTRCCDTSATGVRSPQTNGVIERWFGTSKYEHVFRSVIADGNA